MSSAFAADWKTGEYGGKGTGFQDGDQRQSDGKQRRRDRKYRLIKKGKLPNLKRVIEDGVNRRDWAMIGALPSVTPPNWCSLGTGSWPRTHGITCYNNHTLGKDLQIIEHNWDSRRVESEFI